MNAPIAVNPTPPKPGVIPNKAPSFKITRGRKHAPKRVVFYTPEGLGKTTFAASAPKPIFLAMENGTDNFDVARLEREDGRPPATFEELLAAGSQLVREKHDFLTLVVDTLDWCEPIVWDFIIRRDFPNKVGVSIEDYGFGKGYTVALDEWRRLVRMFEAIQNAGMNVLILAHSQVKTFKNPQGADFDRYNLKVHEKAAGLFKEWCDLLLFGQFETMATVRKAAEKEGVHAKGKGFSTGSRLIHTVRTAAYDAKNRHGLPESLPLGTWGDLEAAITAGKPIAELETQIREAATKLGETQGAEIIAAIPRAENNPDKLSILLNHTLGQLALAGKEV